MGSSSPIRIMTNTELEKKCERFHKSSRSSSRNSTQTSSTYKKYRPSPLITKENGQKNATNKDQSTRSR